MGNKSCPRALRLGISQSFDANWFAEPRFYALYLKEDVEIRKYFDKNFRNAVISRLIINRTKDVLEIKLTCLRPSYIVGKKTGENDAVVKYLTLKYGKEVKLKIFDISKPELNAACVARDVANELSKKGASCRRIIKKHAQSIKRSGALGVRIQCAGRLAGAEIARTEWCQEGAVPRQKFRADIDYCQEKSHSSWGISGVKVWIYKGDVVDSKGKGE